MAEAPAIDFAADLRVLKLAGALHKAVEAALKDPSASKLATLEAARADLREALVGDAPVERSFRSLSAVADWLKTQGYKVSTSSIYGHAKRGLIRPGADGRVSQSDAERYAERHLKRLDEVGGGDEEAARRRQLADAVKAEAQAKLFQAKAEQVEGNLIPRAQVEMDFAARAAVFRSDLLNLARTAPGDILQIVGGDSARAPELVAHLERTMEEIMDRYAQGSEFQVEL